MEAQPTPTAKSKQEHSKDKRREFRCRPKAGTPPLDA